MTGKLRDAVEDGRSYHFGSYYSIFLCDDVLRLPQGL